MRCKHRCALSQETFLVYPVIYLKNLLTQCFSTVLYIKWNQTKYLRSEYWFWMSKYTETRQSKLWPRSKKTQLKWCWLRPRSINWRTSAPVGSHSQTEELFYDLFMLLKGSAIFQPPSTLVRCNTPPGHSRSSSVGMYCRNRRCAHFINLLVYHPITFYTLCLTKQP